METVFSVSAFNRMIQQTLNNSIPSSWVAGEISNFTAAASGHWYFSLKDAQAQVRCVMFRSRNQFLDWQPAHGQQIEVRATAGLFEARGEFQLQVEQLRHAGAGALFEAFERLKKKLAQEGLFDQARKRAIPPLPRRIGIVTSPQGAALQDVLTTLNRLMPALPIVIYPCLVQGNGAAEAIARAIEAAGQRQECDALILCRGGGSLEDLWPFNEESVARAVAACPLPIISGVGHETDVTIADFVADLRAPTPTAAASLACTHQEQLRMRFDALQARLHTCFARRIEQWRQQLRLLQARLVHPGEQLRNRHTLLQQLALRLRGAMRQTLQYKHMRLEPLATALIRQRPKTDHAVLLQWQQDLQRAMRQLLAQTQLRLDEKAAHLQHLSPLAVLARGYSLATDAQGHIVRDASRLESGDLLRLRFATGSALARIQRIQTDAASSPEPSPDSD